MLSTGISWYALIDGRACQASLKCRTGRSIYRANNLVDGEVSTSRTGIGFEFIGPDDRFLHSNEHVAVTTPDNRRPSGADLVTRPAATGCGWW